ncbi:MAG TPA: acyl-CoA dehydrogenase family protein, partial [Methylomirabilota bacterium]|nr:acyl-CoA dehydrogenase family protein [Methylomirabilota bacterium]
MVTLVDQVSSAGAPGASVADAARGFVPRIRQLARRMELARRLDDELVEDMDTAGLFSVIVPKRWGGAGLGPHELNEVAEIIAAGDVSTAWVTVFYNLHSWFLCRYPLEVQQELFARGPSVRAAAILSQPGMAHLSGGRLRVNGSWGYATGMLHASHALVPVLIEGDEGLQWVILPRGQLEIVDDWDVASMAATGSVTITATDAVVP